MKLTILCLAIVLSLGAASDAEALFQDWGGMENDWGMPTGTSFSGGSSSAPRAVVCYALNSAGQRCRGCRPKYDRNGVSLGIQCVPLTENASCGCDMLNIGCTPYGSCSYFQ